MQETKKHTPTTKAYQKAQRSPPLKENEKPKGYHGIEENIRIIVLKFEHQIYKLEKVKEDLKNLVYKKEGVKD